MDKTVALNVEDVITRLLEGKSSTLVGRERDGGDVWVFFPRCRRLSSRQAQPSAPPPVYDSHWLLVLFSTARGQKVAKNVELLEGEIRGLCLKSKEIFLAQDMLLELAAPLKICGKHTYSMYTYYIGSMISYISYISLQWCTTLLIKRTSNICVLPTITI